VADGDPGLGRNEGLTCGLRGSRHDRIAWRIDGDSMIGEREIGAIGNARHVARHAGQAGHRLAMHLVRVASLAARVIRGGILIQLPVRGMAGETIQAAVAAPEAGAGRQSQRLIPGVAWIAQVGNLFPHLGIGSVALAAEAVHGRGGELRGRVQRVVGGIANVRGGGTVADFATHAEFVGDDLIVLA
jgi:hypothetical protein